MGKMKKFGVTRERKKTRKEKRKEQRVLKKVKRNEHYFKNSKAPAPEHPYKIAKGTKHELCIDVIHKTQENEDLRADDVVTKKVPFQQKTLVQKIREASKNSKIIAERRKNAEKRSRNAQLKEANKAEERQIKHLATLMKMNKRKKKGKAPSLPKVFVSDGLDYLLDVTDPDKLRDMRLEQPTFEDADDDFETDMAVVTTAGGGEDPADGDDASLDAASGDEYQGSEDEQSPTDSEGDCDNVAQTDEGDHVGDEGDVSDGSEIEISDEPDATGANYQVPGVGEAGDDGSHDGKHDSEDEPTDDDGSHGVEHDSVDEPTDDDGSHGGEHDSVDEPTDDDGSHGGEHDSVDEPTDADGSHGGEHDSVDEPTDDDGSHGGEHDSVDEPTDDDGSHDGEHDTVDEPTDQGSSDENMKVDCSDEENAENNRHAHSESRKDATQNRESNSSGKSRKRKLSEQEEEAQRKDPIKTKRKKLKGKGEALHPDGVWEDIYGRFRSKDGSILTGTGACAGNTSTAAPPGGRYVPPALRAQQMPLSGGKRAELALLRRRLQGQLNRLSARSARGVLALVEELYGAHSRHDTSQALTRLVHEACVSAAAVRPDRLVMEHVALVAALHANVGTEVGAHFLLKTAQQFHKLLTADSLDDESKELDNLVMILAQLYAFRVTDSRVVYDILSLLVERFCDKDVQLILTVLRAVGFTMRKDDPAALREFIVRLQARAVAAAAADAPPADGSRIRFLLDIVLAIRNNNMNKIPQYDPGLGQELSKLVKTLVNSNQTITELNISLEDLLKAEERGKWWVVGSAWSGALQERQSRAPADSRAEAAPTADRQRYSVELLELARKQRMNTDLRRNVFCVLMTAEDYLDGFQKLMRLGVKGPQQEQEMVSVVLSCGLREQTFNPYYSHLLERLCTVDRKYQMRIKTSVWVHLKDLASLGSGPTSNLAKILAHLISTGGLSIAVLKVVEFSEMSRPMVRFLRQLLLSLLLQPDDADTVRDLFSRASGPPLKHLRDSLVLFLHHFVLRNKSKLADTDAAQALDARAREAVIALKATEGVIRL